MHPHPGERSQASCLEMLRFGRAKIKVGIVQLFLAGEV